MVRQCNWWCPPTEYEDIQDDWFIRFFELACNHFHDADPHNIVVYSLFGNRTFPNEVERKKHVNFLFVGENTYLSNEDPLCYTMDAVLSFFENTERSIRLPLWMIYWNFHLHGLFDIVPSDTRHRLHKSVIVVSHDNNGVRRQICDKVMHGHGIPVDSSFPGVPYNDLVTIPTKGTKHKHGLLQKYMFNICAENSSREGYVTEKIFQALAAGCVPIYWGHAPVEPRILRQDAFINISSDESMNQKINVPTKDSVWKQNALVRIFSTYLKVWSVVYTKMGLKELNKAIAMHVYVLQDRSECCDVLCSHWLRHQNMFEPRAHFRVMDDGTNTLVDIFMEDLADDMYITYKT